VKTTFEIRSGELFIHNASTGIVVWHGSFDKRPVRKAIPVPGSDDGIILLGKLLPKTSDFGDVLRVTSAGDLVWKADIPDSQDVYVEVYWIGGNLVGNTWNGWRVVFNISTGKIQSRSFVE
jgi:hypothetical protein